MMGHIALHINLLLQIIHLLFEQLRSIFHFLKFVCIRLHIRFVKVTCRTFPIFLAKLVKICLSFKYIYFWFKWPFNRQICILNLMFGNHAQIHSFVHVANRVELLTITLRFPDIHWSWTWPYLYMLLNFHILGHFFKFHEVFVYHGGLLPWFVAFVLKCLISSPIFKIF